MFVNQVDAEKIANFLSNLPEECWGPDLLGERELRGEEIGEFFIGSITHDFSNYSLIRLPKY